MYIRAYIHIRAYIRQIAKIEGMEAGGFWFAVPYRFHTGFISARFHTPVSYPGSILLLFCSVSYPGFILCDAVAPYAKCGVLGCPEDFGAKLILGIRDRLPRAVTLTYDLQGKRVGIEQVSGLKEIAVSVSCPVSNRFHTRFTPFLLFSAECVFAVCATACAKLA